MTNIKRVTFFLRRSVVCNIMMRNVTWWSMNDKLMTAHWLSEWWVADIVFVGSVWRRNGERDVSLFTSTSRGAHDNLRTHRNRRQRCHRSANKRQKAQWVYLGNCSVYYCCASVGAITAMFLETNISQNSLATSLKCGGICTDRFSADFLSLAFTFYFFHQQICSLSKGAEYAPTPLALGAIVYREISVVMF